MALASSIRRVEADDVATAVALLEAQLEEHAIATSREALSAVVRCVVSDPRYGFMLLAMADDRAVGIAYAAAHLSAEHGGVIGWLEELYVEPAARGRGLGSALLDHLARRARALGWRGLELEIVRGHERAVPLYQRHSFLSVDRARFSCIFDS